MIERRNCLRLPLEAFTELLGGNFDRNVALQAWIVGLVPSPMPPFPIGATISYGPSLSPGESAIWMN
jgi:hypothetical protein